MKIIIDGTELTLTDWRVQQLARMIREERELDTRGVWAKENDRQVRVCDLSESQRAEILAVVEVP